jgi:hypothetical protein
MPKSIAMGYPAYSDTGYRFRYNQFDRNDGYLMPDNLDNKFFDFFEYNTDTWQSAPTGSENMIAELYFRLQVDQTTHNRVVYAIMDFIGDLGGVKGIMMQIAAWFVGSYSAFHASFATIRALYRVRDPMPIFLTSRKNVKECPEIQTIKLPLRTRLFLWL